MKTDSKTENWDRPIISKDTELLIKNKQTNKQTPKQKQKTSKHDSLITPQICSPLKITKLQSFIVVPGNGPGDRGQMRKDLLKKIYKGF